MSHAGGNATNPFFRSADVQNPGSSIFIFEGFPRGQNVNEPFVLQRSSVNSHSWLPVHRHSHSVLTCADSITRAGIGRLPRSEEGTSSGSGTNRTFFLRLVRFGKRESGATAMPCRVSDQGLMNCHLGCFRVKSVQTAAHTATANSASSLEGSVPSFPCRAPSLEA